MPRTALLLVIVCLLLSVGTAGAQCTADPANSTTSLDLYQKLYICPDGLGPCPFANVTVQVRNAAGNPCSGVVVTVVVDPACISGSRVKFCNPVTLSGVTGLNGMVTINVAGGGCCKQANAVRIDAGGVTIRVFNAVQSSDYAGWDNTGLPGRWSLTLTPVDLASFILSPVAAPSCHDYDNIVGRGPVDLAIFVNCYKAGTNFCLP